MKHIPRKRFGQNFLQDQNIIDQIITAIDPQPTDHIIEIGPGQGALTKPLWQYCQQLEVIEIDRDLAAALNTILPPHKTSQYPKLHQQDVLTIDFNQLKRDKPFRIVGNLPYNISTPLLFHLFKYIDHIQDIYAMLQKEVVDRLCAQPGNKAYGKLSVMAQFYCQVEPVMLVPAHAFYPAPKVESAIVKLSPHATKMRQGIHVDKLQKIVQMAFGQRRKTLRNTLKPLFTEAELRQCDIDPQARAEQLSLSDFLRLLAYGTAGLSH